MFVGFLQYLSKINFRLCIKIVKIICKVMVSNNIVRIRVPTKTYRCSLNIVNYFDNVLHFSYQLYDNNMFCTSYQFEQNVLIFFYTFYDYTSNITLK